MLFGADWPTVGVCQRVFEGRLAGEEGIGWSSWRGKAVLLRLEGNRTEARDRKKARRKFARCQAHELILHHLVKRRLESTLGLLPPSI